MSETKPEKRGRGCPPGKYKGVKKGPYSKPTNDLTRYEKMVRHFANPNEYPLTPQLEDYIDTLQYVRDLLYAHPMALARKILMKAKRNGDPGYTWYQAQEAISETMRFFSLDNVEQRKTEFWLTLSIQHHEDLLKMAKLSAKTAKDFAACSEIQNRIDKLRGLHEKQTDGLDFTKMGPRVTIVQIGDKRLKADELPLKLGAKLLEMVEDVEFTEEEMEQALNDGEQANPQ